MRKIPVHPIIRLQLAQLLHSEYGFSAGGAVKTATKLIEQLRERNMDIVKGDWMADPLVARTAFRWEDIPRIADEYEADGRTPWNNPELR